MAVFIPQSIAVRKVLETVASLLKTRVRTQYQAWMVNGPFTYTKEVGAEQRTRVAVGQQSVAGDSRRAYYKIIQVMQYR